MTLTATTTAHHQYLHNHHHYTPTSPSTGLQKTNSESTTNVQACLDNLREEQSNLQYVMTDSVVAQCKDIWSLRSLIELEGSLDTVSTGENGQLVGPQLVDDVEIDQVPITNDDSMETSLDMSSSMDIITTNSTEVVNSMVNSSNGGHLTSSDDERHVKLNATHKDLGLDRCFDIVRPTIESYTCCHKLTPPEESLNITSSSNTDGILVQSLSNYSSSNTESSADFVLSPSSRVIESKDGLEELSGRIGMQCFTDAKELAQMPSEDCLKDEFNKRADSPDILITTTSGLIEDLSLAPSPNKYGRVYFNGFRDYSIDRKTNDIFNEFTKIDPKLRRTRRGHPNRHHSRARHHLSKKFSSKPPLAFVAGNSRASSLSSNNSIPSNHLNEPTSPVVEVRGQSLQPLENPKTDNCEIAALKHDLMSGPENGNELTGDGRASRISLNNNNCRGDPPQGDSHSQNYLDHYQDIIITSTSDKAAAQFDSVKLFEPQDNSAVPSAKKNFLSYFRLKWGKCNRDSIEEETEEDLEKE